MKKFCNSIFSYHRRCTSVVMVGENVAIGGENHIVVQSMATVSTNDIENSVLQALSIAKSGAELVRFTTQGVAEAENLGVIRLALRSENCFVPLVADIHFNPLAAFVAAKNVEKVRINPGNFVDKRGVGEYSNTLYESEKQRLDETFCKLLDVASQNNTAIRVGVNHGSLSERIVGRYGDTIEGMVESAMEFLRIAARRNFDKIVVSLKSSNTQVMVRAYRMLVAVMAEEGFSYPLHLGVTEAGDGDEGRIRSAVGIGALLVDGIGDTIRVSLTENPEKEVVFADKMLSYVEKVAANKIDDIDYSLESLYQPFQMRPSSVPFVVVGDSCAKPSEDDCYANELTKKHIVIEHRNIYSTRAKLLDIERRRGEGSLTDCCVVVKASYKAEREMFLAQIGVDFGALLIDGFIDGLWISNSLLSENDTLKIVLSMLQASRRRVSSVEYISCPGCGRTLYDIQDVLARVKAATEGLKSIKIAVMGCIVNGPGEMADADYGYVGAGRGKVTLYRKGEVYKKNIEQSAAIGELVELLRINNEFLV